MHQLIHLDLFSGIGGFALAARMVGGIETRQFIEIDPYCQRVLAKNFPGVPIHGDAKTFTAQPGDFDLITAGFPCQPHSTAGSRKASQDDRDLWPELYRIICQVQPRWIVLENVRGLLSSEAGQFFRDILWDLARAGLDAEWAVIPASDLGAPHQRERLLILAYANSVGYSQPQLWNPPLAEKGASEPSPKSLLLADWPKRPSQVSEIPRAIDGLPPRLDAVRSLGNSISPQVAAIPLRRVVDLAGTSR
jgi:DNA (cytosine-5)-methyltransferase 1